MIGDMRSFQNEPSSTTTRIAIPPIRASTTEDSRDRCLNHHGVALHSDLYFRNLSAIMDSFPPVTTTFFHSGMNMLGARVVHERPAARAHQNAHRTE